MHRRDVGRQAGRDDYLNARSLLLTISKEKQKLAAANNCTDIPDELRLSIRLENPGGGVYALEE